MGIAVLLDRPILVLDPGDLRSVSVTADTPQLGVLSDAHPIRPRNAMVSVSCLVVEPAVRHAFKTNGQLHNRDLESAS
ncbi:hypothetical protein CIB48_g5280 [Xylaria polymorpha]|nr:hypothetical protein CIB48_g5280 [Xylaria polymorpha]